NPPPTCLEPDAGFEVREAHRDPIRLRAANYLPDRQKECTTKTPERLRCHHYGLECNHSREAPILHARPFLGAPYAMVVRVAPKVLSLAGDSANGRRAVERWRWRGCPRRQAGQAELAHGAGHRRVLTRLPPRSPAPF